MDLDTAISNLHKDLANVTPAWDRVWLNATKCITLHALCMQCLDRINYNAPYTSDNIVSIHNKYLEATLTDSSTKGLGEVAIPKLTSTK